MREKSAGSPQDRVETKRYNGKKGGHPVNRIVAIVQRSSVAISVIAITSVDKG